MFVISGTNDSLVDVACNVPFDTLRQSTTTSLQTTTVTKATTTATEAVKTPESDENMAKHWTTPPSQDLLQLTASVSTPAPVLKVVSSTHVTVTSPEMKTEPPTQTKTTATETTSVTDVQTTADEYDNNNGEEEEISLISDISNENIDSEENNSPIEVSMNNEMVFADEDKNGSNDDFILVDDSKFDNKVFANPDDINSDFKELVDDQDGRQASIEPTEDSTGTTENIIDSTFIVISGAGKTQFIVKFNFMTIMLMEKLSCKTTCDNKM